jgi:aspartate racemase
MNQHIGIVGVTAPGAALCYEVICTEAASLETQDTSLEVSLHTHPFNKYLHRVEAGDWQGVADLMLSSAAKLAQVGATLLVAPCNTIHLAFDLVAPRSSLPWLHIAEEVAQQAKRSGFQRLGVLGTKLVMESPVYRTKLESLGIECLIPAEFDRERINSFLFEEMAYGKFTSEARSYLLEVINQLQTENCDAIGLCCTEIPLLLEGVHTPLPLLDSTRILARSALQRAMNSSAQ